MSPDGFQIADIFTWQVAAWVLVILVAGFIGQFGKSFAKYVMSRLNRKKIQETTPSVSVPPGKYSSQPASVEASATVTGDAKIRKKEAKALVKAKKKEMKQKGRD